MIQISILITQKIELVSDKKKLQIAIGSRIRALRETKGISQQNFAHDCNIEKSNYHRIEAGNTNPTIYTLQKIATNLGITLSELVLIEQPLDSKKGY